MPRSPIEIVDFIFSKGGPLEKVKGQHREKQAELANYRIRSLVAGTANTVVEADTGVGKSLATLIPAAVMARIDPDVERRTVIATGTISLREHLTDPKEEALINDLLEQGFAWAGLPAPKPIRIAARPSYTAYADVEKARALGVYLQGRPVTPDVDHALKYVAFITDPSKVDPTFDEWLSEADSEGRMPSITRTVGGQTNLTELDMCLSGNDVRAAKDIIKRFGQQKDAADQADIMVVTHTMLMWNNLTFGNALNTTPEVRDEEGNLTEEASTFKDLVIDEADNLLSLSMNVTDDMVSLADLDEFVDQLDKSDAEWPTARKLLDQISLALEGVYPMARRGHPQSLVEVMGVGYHGFVDQVAEFTVALNAIVQRGGDYLDLRQVESFNRSLINIVHMKTLAGVTRGDTLKNEWTGSRLFVDAFYADHRVLRLGTKPLKGHNIINRIWLWNLSSFKTVMHMSATLSSASKGLANYRNRVGVYKSLEVEEYSVKVEKFGRITDIYYAASDAPMPMIDPPKPKGSASGESTSGVSYDNPDYLRFVAKMAVRAHENGGRTLLLLSSAHALTEIERIIEYELMFSHKLFVQRKGMKTKALMEDFAKHERGLWLGLKWAGENFVDPITGKSLLARVMIGKIPFAIANPVREADEFIGKNGETVNLRFINAMEDGFRKFIQGLGRGIRNPDDEIELWICDPRFPKPVGHGWAIFPSTYNNPAFKNTAGTVIPARFTTGVGAAKNHLVSLDQNGLIQVSGAVRKPNFGTFKPANAA